MYLKRLISFFALSILYSNCHSQQLYDTISTYAKIYKIEYDIPKNQTYYYAKDDTKRKFIVIEKSNTYKIVRRRYWCIFIKCKHSNKTMLGVSYYVSIDNVSYYIPELLTFKGEIVFFANPPIKKQH